MELHKYQDHTKYIKAQKGSFNKIGNVWVSDGEIDLVSDYILLNMYDLSFGICHGVRDGYEVEKLRQDLSVNVIGTDLFQEQRQSEHIIQMDFHKVKPEWINNVDFIYSNALDHSYDPELCLQQWKRCLKKGGLCFLHWSVGHNENTISTGDCFAASEEEYEQMMKKYFRLKTAIRMGEGDHGGTHSTIFVGQKEDVNE